MPKKAKKTKGASANIRKGMSKERVKSKGYGNMFFLRAGETKPLQFLTTPKDFIEYEIHNFQAEGRWQYIPCIGDECPLCDDDDRDISSKRYRFVAPVVSLRDRKPQIIEGPKTLAIHILQAFERKPQSFTKRVWDLTKFATKPVQYSLGVADERPLPTSKLEVPDLEGYIQDQVDRYYGVDVAPSALDDTDIEEEEETTDEEEEDLDLEDEDEEEEEEDEDEDDEDEDEEDDDEDDLLDSLDDFDDDEEEEEKPAPKKKAKKAAPKKKPAAKSTKKSKPRKR